MKIILGVLFAPILFVAIAAPATAQDVAPIAKVIEVFKAQIRDAQARGSTDCPLRIHKVEFRFVVAQTTVFDANLGREVKIFGVVIGGKLGGKRAETARSTIDISLKPDPKAAKGLADVAGSGPDFGNLILHTKEQIAAAADSDPPLTLDSVKIQTDVLIKREGKAGLSLAIIDAGTKVGDEAAHRVILTLSPSEPGAC